MKPEHTEGPWTIHQNGDGSYSILGEKISKKEYKWIIGFIQNGEILTEEQLANAKLIAATPDMLCALRSFVEGMTGKEEFVGHNQLYLEQVCLPRAKEAIKKATE